MNISFQIVKKQPKPLSLKRRHASFLEPFADRCSALIRYLPESVNSFVTQWVELGWDSEVYRERNCRSDTLVTHWHDDIIPRRLTKSVPNMKHKQDADGFALPLTPVSTRSRLGRQDEESAFSYGSSVAPSDTSDASIGSSRKKTLVEDPYYRDNNLAENSIFLRNFYEELPENIAELVDHISKDRDSPGLSSEQLRPNTRLHDLEMGTAEPAVENYFKANIFPDFEPLDCLKRIDKSPMTKQLVPDVGSKLKVSTPCPDMLYGYNRFEAFPQQQAQLRSMGNDMVANTQGLIYPFFVIEFKADGPGGSGSMWVATNQCLGGAASCVNIVERLNHQLRQCQNVQVRPVDSAAFSIAMNGTEARLYISWKQDELKYYTRKVDSFLLQKPKDYVEFRKHVLNIVDWGNYERLNEIRQSLDSLLEDNRIIASRLAKSRPAPSPDHLANNHCQKRRASSSHKSNSTDISVQEEGSGGATG